MNEHLSPLLGGGLLSLNLAQTPQSSTPGSTGAVPLLGSFSAAFNQHNSSTTASTVEFASGEILPLQGEGVPQALAQLPAETNIQEQLQQIAAMLEHSSSDNELPPELKAELAKALREYSEQQPVIPDNAQSADAEAPLQTPSAVVEEVAQAAKGATVADPGLIESAQKQQVQADLAKQQVNNAAETQVTENSSRVTSVADSLNAQAIQTEADKLATQRAEAATAVVADKTTLVGSAASKEAASGVVPPNPQVVAEQLKNTAPESQQGVAQANDQLKTEAAVKSEPLLAGKTQSEQGLTAAQTAQTAKNAQVNIDAELAKEAVKPAIAESDVKKVVPNNTAASSVANRSVPTEVSVPVDTAKPDLVLKPQSENASVKKIESALEFTQQLLQKAAPAEKSDNAATQVLERLASNTIGQTNSAAPTVAQKTVTDGQNLMMPQHVKVSTPAWNNALGERAIMIAAQNTRVAEIQLDPPELGALNIRVNINQDQVSLSFTSPHAHVRDAVEQSLPRLREMFAEQGLELQDSSVSDQSAEQQGREQMARDDAAGGRYGGGGAVEGDEQDVAVNGKPVSLVDYYA